MEDDQAKNIVILALLQVGAILFTIASCGLAIRVHEEFFGERLRAALGPQLALRDYGAWLLLVPLIWSVATLYIRNYTDLSDRIKAAALPSGVVLFVALSFVALRYGVSRMFYFY